MKRVTASEARRDWFRLLDEVVNGEVVVIERKGQRIVLRREPSSRRARERFPDYRRLIQAQDASAADTWSWEWLEPESELGFRDRSQS
ncbi:MAG: type II toxin-antitoxin system Phd/YefM family antitoxin [Longimicrobiales bacterium]